MHIHTSITARVLHPCRHRRWLINFSSAMLVAGMVGIGCVPPTTPQDPSDDGLPRGPDPMPDPTLPNEPLAAELSP